MCYALLYHCEESEIITIKKLDIKTNANVKGNVTNEKELNIKKPKIIHQNTKNLKTTKDVIENAATDNQLNIQYIYQQNNISSTDIPTNLKHTSSGKTAIIKDVDRITLKNETYTVENMNSKNYSSIENLKVFNNKVSTNNTIRSTTNNVVDTTSRNKIIQVQSNIDNRSNKETTMLEKATDVTPRNVNKDVLQDLKNIEDKKLKSKEVKLKEIPADTISTIESLLNDIKTILKRKEANRKGLDSFKGYVPISEEIEVPEYIPQEPTRKIFRDGLNLIWRNV